MPQPFELQPILQNELVRLEPLKESDFERLYAVASDPLIWEQHPNKNRYQRVVFQTFFDGAMASEGAFLIFDQQSNQVIGSSRYYDWDKNEKSLTIGYTFFARDHWGSLYNPTCKKLMLDHAFQFVDRVFFHIGALNVRSQKAIEKLGAEKIAELEMAYHGETNNLNFIYQIERLNWETKNK